jgi:hypothetical protein
MLKKEAGRAHFGQPAAAHRISSPTAVAGGVLPPHLGCVRVRFHEVKVDNGVKFGRRPKLSDCQRKEAIKRRAAGETSAEIANPTPSTSG